MEADAAGSAVTVEVTVEDSEAVAVEGSEVGSGETAVGLGETAVGLGEIAVGLGEIAVAVADSAAEVVEGSGGREMMDTAPEDVVAESGIKEGSATGLRMGTDLPVVGLLLAMVVRPDQAGAGLGRRVAGTVEEVGIAATSSAKALAVTTKETRSDRVTKIFLSGRAMLFCLQLPQVSCSRSMVGGACKYCILLSLCFIPLSFIFKRLA